MAEPTGWDLVAGWIEASRWSVEALGVVGKAGAEGVWVAVAEDGTAVAVKALDGANRVPSAVAVALLAARGADQATQSAANPAAQPVQGGATGMARNPDTTSPATRDPMLSGGQTTDGRSPGTTSGTESASRPESSASTTAAGAGSVGAPHASGTRNDTTGGTTITNAPVGAAMDGSAGGQAAGFKNDDPAAGGPGLVQQRERDDGGLARAGRGDEHGVGSLGQGGGERRQRLVDGKVVRAQGPILPLIFGRSPEYPASIRVPASD